MPDISTRHIPKSWPEWVNWNDSQKTVTTMCRARVAPRFTGIPGVTEQAPVVMKRGKPVWGWCMDCVVEFRLYLLPPIMTKDNAPEEIFSLHRKAIAAISQQYAASGRSHYPR